jgi:probable HAF family extracellular repeat protein
MISASASGYTVAQTATPIYSIADLGLLREGVGGQAMALNAAGWVVGAAPVAFPGMHAFLHTGKQSPYMPDGGPLYDLGTMGGQKAIATAIDDLGRVVGLSQTATGDTQAFLWARGGNLRSLGTLGGRRSAANGISYSRGMGTLEGVIVGGSETSTGELRAFLTIGGGLVDLGTLGGRNSEARGVNAAGQVVGMAESAAGTMRAFLYTAGRMSDLGTLGGRYSMASAINAAGRIVGSSETKNGASHAYLYQSSQMQDLGTLGGQNSAAMAINSSGQVVGRSDTAGSRRQAFLYSGSMINLNSLLAANSGWELLAATGINDAGQIVGYGVINEQLRAFIMKPPPSRL